MEPVRLIRSRTVVLPEADIDTDQIFPARFLTTTAGGGFADMLFADWRFDADGKPRPSFALNRPEAAGCEVLVAGPNFGHSYPLRPEGNGVVVDTVPIRIAHRRGVVEVHLDKPSGETTFRVLLRDGFASQPMTEK